MQGQEPLAGLLDDEDLLRALAEARALGFLGPGPVEAHIRHSLRFVVALGPRLRGPALDLGSGGGVPGLVLARLLPEVAWVLLDAHARRTAFLADAARSLGLDNVAVLTGRAEAVGREAPHRGRLATVVSRSFGPPAVVAECAAPLLCVGGHLAVSEPPAAAPDRWPAEGLATLGLAARESEDPAIWVGEQVVSAEERWPRRVGIPAKRPLF